MVGYYSPARAHVARIQAELASSHALDIGSADMAGFSVYDRFMALLGTHKRALSSISSMETRQAQKAQYEPEYADYLAGVLAKKPGTQDEIITTWLVWYLDIAKIDKALELAAYAIPHDLKLPADYSRSLSATFIEELAEMALKQPDKVSLEQLQQAQELTEDADMLDEISAKLQRALGEHYASLDNLKAAIHHMDRALELNPNCGCKKQRDALARQLAKMPG